MPARAAALGLLAPALLVAVPHAADAATSVPQPDTVKVLGWGNSTDAPRSARFTQVSENYWGGLGLTADGKVKTWGDNYHGSLALPASLADETVTKVSQGYEQGLVQLEDGSLVTWGYYLGDNYPGDPEQPAYIPSSLDDKTVVDFVAGGYHDLAVTSDGKVTAWGREGSSELNVPSSLDDKTVTRVFAGLTGSAALASDGTLTSWGGLAATPSSLDGKTIVDVSIDSGSALALTSEGKLYGWGYNYSGQLNIPSSLDDKTVTAVAIGGSWAMAATSDGDVVVWGDTSERVGSTVPAALDGAAVVDLQASRYRALALYRAVDSKTPPTISGTATVGQTLTATGGTYDPAPTSTAFQWQADGEDITDATGSTYLLTPADAGKTITVVETAAKTGWGSATATSTATRAVRLAPKTFRVSVPSSVKRGAKLSVSASGLAPGESYTLRFAGEELTTGQADDKGLVKRSVTISKKTTKGKHTLVVRGSATGRSGSDTTIVK